MVLGVLRTLFFDVARVAKKPQAFLIENVKNLLSHDKGNTFRIILQTLNDELDYEVHYKVIDGQHFVQQHRERILINANYKNDKQVVNKLMDFGWRVCIIWECAIKGANKNIPGITSKITKWLTDSKQMLEKGEKGLFVSRIDFRQD